MSRLIESATQTHSLIGDIMTTNTNTNNKGNGDTSSHYDYATIANARKYYTILDDNGRDKAKFIVDELIRKGQLKDAEFYVNALKGEIQRRDNIKKREDARKAAEEKAKEDFMNAKAKHEAENNGNYTIIPEIDAIIKSMIEKGATKATISGALKALAGFNKAQIARYIANNMPDKPKAAHRGERVDFMSRFLERKMTSEEFEDYMQAQSPNVQKRRPMYKAMFDTFNAIHDKYSN